VNEDKKINLRPRNRINLQTESYSVQVREIEETGISITFQEDHLPDHKSTIYESVREEIRQFLLNNYQKLLQECLSNSRKQKDFERIVRKYIQESRKAVPGMTIEDIVANVWTDLCSTGPLDESLKSNESNEIMINGFDQPWLQEGGTDVRADDKISFNNRTHLETVIITKILNSCGKEISEARPIVDARIGDARVNIVGSPISQMKGPIVTIRKFPPISLNPEGFLAYGTASEEMLEFMRLAVEGEASIGMGGATGSGKTTTFKLLGGYIEKGKRVIVIEDTAELRFEKLYPYAKGYHFVSMECRILGDKDLDITIQHLLENAMRMKPHYLIIGEIRKGADLLSAIEAANTGHPTWFTMHGRSARHMFQRMVMRVTQADPSMTQRNATELISDSLDIIMMQKKFKDGKRRVFEIVEIAGFDDETGRADLRTLFEYDVTHGKFVRRNPISAKMVEIFQNAEIPYERYAQFLEPVSEEEKTA